MGLGKTFAVILVSSVVLLGVTLLVALACRPAAEVAFLVMLLVFAVFGLVFRYGIRHVSKPAAWFAYLGSWVIALALPVLFGLLLGFAFSNSHPWDDLLEKLFPVVLSYGVCSSLLAVTVCSPREHPLLYGLNAVLGVLFTAGYLIGCAALTGVFAG